MKQRRRMLMSAGGGGGANVTYTYTGNSIDHGIVSMASGSYRLIELTSSGDLSFANQVTADLWMCNGGSSGGIQYSTDDVKFLACGGGGGYLLNCLAQTFQDAVVSIGAGGTGLSYKAYGSYGGTTSLVLDGVITLMPTKPNNHSYPCDGASGGGGSCDLFYSSYTTSLTWGRGAGYSCYPFEDSSYFQLHCSGGGGQGGYSNQYLSGGAGGSNGGAGGYAQPPSADAYVGGVGGYGAGNGSGSNSNATSAIFYGCGGGGSSSSANIGNGYQGVVYIRIAA